MTDATTPLVDDLTTHSTDDATTLSSEPLPTTESPNGTIVMMLELLKEIGIGGKF